MVRPRRRPTRLARQTCLWRWLSSANNKPSEAEKLPVTLVTGFLGSGKTTLINNMLSKEHGWKLAVIQNEVGEIAIDELLLREHVAGDDAIFVANNGCLCCTVQSDLHNIFAQLLRVHRESPLDAIRHRGDGRRPARPVGSSAAHPTWSLGRQTPRRKPVPHPADRAACDSPPSHSPICGTRWCRGGERGTSRNSGSWGLGAAMGEFGIVVVVDWAGPIVQSLFRDPTISRHVRLDSVLTVVDAEHLPLQLNAGRPSTSAAAPATGGQPNGGRHKAPEGPEEWLRRRRGGSRQRRGTTRKRRAR